MEPQDHSQSMTPLRAESFAHRRAPARGQREGFGPDSNPLLWRLLGYRGILGLPISGIVAAHFCLGATIGLILLIGQMASWQFVRPETLVRLAAYAASAHVLWMAGALVHRVRAWERHSFLDELLLTELSPREICSGISQMGARPKAASFMGLLAPFFFIGTGMAFHHGTTEGVVFVLSFTTAAAFLVLSFHALAWLVLWIMWKSRFSPFAALLAAGWITVLPLAATPQNSLILCGAALLVVAMTLNAALVLAPKVPALFVARRE